MSHHILLKTNSRLGRQKFPFSPLRELVRKGLIWFAVLSAETVLSGQNRKDSRFYGNSRECLQHEARGIRLAAEPRGGHAFVPTRRLEEVHERRGKPGAHLGRRRRQRVFRQSRD